MKAAAGNTADRLRVPDGTQVLSRHWERFTDDDGRDLGVSGRFPAHSLPLIPRLPWRGGPGPRATPPLP